MNDGIFHILLSVPHNNVMDLDNVMRLVNLYAIKRKIRLGAKNSDSLQSWPMMGLSFENDDFIARVGGPEWIHAWEKKFGSFRSQVWWPMFITISRWVTKLGGAGNMSCKVLKIYYMNVCLSRFNMIKCEFFAWTIAIEYIKSGTDDSNWMML